MTKRCPNCGNINKDDVNFCEYCGTNLMHLGKDSSPTGLMGGISDWWKEQSTGGKAAIGIVIFCFIFVVLIVGLGAMASPDKTATTSSSSTNPTSVPYNTPTSSNPTNTSTSSSSSSAGMVQIRVISSGPWSGSYGDVAGSHTVDGSGSNVFTISGKPDIVSAVFQKQDGVSGTLTVEIVNNGGVVERKSTSAAYGVVSVSHSFYQ
jgi:hypothetical protein